MPESKKWSELKLHEKINGYGSATLRVYIGVAVTVVLWAGTQFAITIRTQFADIKNMVAEVRHDLRGFVCKDEYYNNQNKYRHNNMLFSIHLYLLLLVWLRI